MQTKVARTARFIEGKWLDWRGAVPGLILLGVAVLAIIGLQGTPSGTASRPGAGALPMMLAIGLLVCGALALILPSKRLAIGSDGVWSLTMVITSGIVLMIGVPVIGALASAGLAGAVAARAAPKAKPLDMAISAVGGVLAVAASVYLLAVPMPLWPGRL